MDALLMGHCARHGRMQRWGHEPTVSRTQDTMRVLPEAIQAGEAVAEALFRAMPQDGLRTHGHGTLTCAGQSAAVSQKAETETVNMMSGAVRAMIHGKCSYL